MDLINSPFIVYNIFREEVDNDGERIEHYRQKEHTVEIAFFLEDVVMWAKYPYEDFYDDKSPKTNVKLADNVNYTVLIDFMQFSKLMSMFKKQQGDIGRLIMNN